LADPREWILAAHRSKDTVLEEDKKRYSPSTTFHGRTSIVMLSTRDPPTSHEKYPSDKYAIQLVGLKPSPVWDVCDRDIPPQQEIDRSFVSLDHLNRQLNPGSLLWDGRMRGYVLTEERPSDTVLEMDPGRRAMPL